MLYNIFPEWLYNKIKQDFLQDYIFEIRIRTGKPIMINYKGRYVPLIIHKTDRFNGRYAENVIATSDIINHILSVATKQSLYAYNEQIKQCFITTDSGVRIGICGTVVYNENKVSTIKNVTSINIRIPHEVTNCSDKIFRFVVSSGEVKNTLIISPPSAGKTTLIRDITKKLSDEANIQNILVVDERYEIAGLNGEMNVGNFVDVISGSEKSFAFNSALKTMNPSVIVTDEVSKESDIESIKQTIKSGVKVIASAHAKDIQELKSKRYFESLIKDKYFDRIVVLSKRVSVGTIESVYDENLRGIYIPFMIWK